MKNTIFSRLVLSGLSLGVMLACSVAPAATLPYLATFSTNGNFDGLLVSGVSGGIPAQMSVSGGVMTYDSVLADNSGGQVLVGLVEVQAIAATDIIEVSGDFTVSNTNSGSDIGLFAFNTNSNGFGTGGGGITSSGYLADFKPDGSFRIVEGIPGFTAVIASAPAGTFSFAFGETYNLSLIATPITAGVDTGKLALNFTVNDPTGGPKSISVTSTLLASTGDYFGTYTRVGNNGPSHRNYIGSYDNISVSAVPEPGGLILAGLSIAGCLGLAWRRRS